MDRNGIPQRIPRCSSVGRRDIGRSRRRRRRNLNSFSGNGTGICITFDDDDDDVKVFSELRTVEVRCVFFPLT
jgi:hypothetical protein